MIYKEIFLNYLLEKKKNVKENENEMTRKRILINKNLKDNFYHI